MRLKSKNDLNTRVIQFGIYGIVTFSILTFGAVQVWAFSVVEMAVFFVVFLCILDWARTSSFTIRKDPAWILLLLFIVVVLMQLLPLPSPVLKFLSPSTYQLYQDTLPGYTNGNESADVVRKTAQEVTGVKLKESVTADRVAKAEGFSDNYVEIREWRSISINGHGTFTMLLKVLAYMGLFFVVVIFKWPMTRSGRMPFFTGLVWLIFFLGLFNAIFFFIQKASGMRIMWLGPLAPPTGNCLGTFKAYNNFSEFLEMVVPLSMGLLILQNYRETGRSFFRRSVVLSRIASLFSKSGLLSFGIVLIISALLLSLVTGGFVTFPITIFILFVFVISLICSLVLNDFTFRWMESLHRPLVQALSHEAKRAVFLFEIQGMKALPYPCKMPAILDCKAPHLVVQYEKT